MVTVQLQVPMIVWQQLPPHDGHIPEPSPFGVYIAPFLHEQVAYLPPRCQASPVLTVTLQVAIKVSFGVKLTLVTHYFIDRWAATSSRFEVVVSWSIAANIKMHLQSRTTTLLIR